MKTLRPEWMLSGGCMLAFLAAALNATFILRLGTSVSHLTGDLSGFAIGLTQTASHSAQLVLPLSTALVGFLLGAATAGAVIHHPTVELSQPYGRSVAAIGGVVLLAHACLPAAPIVAVLLAAGACGFQNALATHYRGIILRTTHVTGLLTDLGVAVGMRLRGHRVDSWRLAVPFALVVSFFLGAMGGAALAHAQVARAGLWIGLVYLCGGLSWIVAKRWILRR